jgi:patatin-like phospholipase/acyl hydrolase
MNNKLKVLALDGGGIRGILPCAVLAEIERLTDRPICELFDLVAGTSTGGIIACGLSTPDPSKPHKPKFSAAEFGKMYEEKGAEIFQKSSGMLNMVTSIFDQAYEHHGLENLLLEYLGDTELRQTLTELLVTSYDIESRRPFYFLSRLAKKDPAKENYRLRDIARSTSAAPTYFEPNPLAWHGGGGPLALVDGGVFANNPAMLAYTEAIELLRLRNAAPRSQPDTGLESFDPVTTPAGGMEGLEGFAPTVSTGTSDIFMLSLGTGRSQKPYPYASAKTWGLAQWAKPIIDILMQGVSETVDYQMHYVLPNDANGARHYVRINPFLPQEMTEMADVSAGNIKALKALAQRSVQENQAAIAEVCKVLLS